MAYPSTPLYKALDLTQKNRWAGTRSELASVHHAVECIDFLHTRGVRSVDGITKEHALALKQFLKSKGLAPSSINRKLMALSAVCSTATEFGKASPQRGRIGTVRAPNKRKWWLSPEVEEDLVAKLQADPKYRPMAWYIRWTTRTGLRVEETLRTVRGDFVGLNGDKPILKVNGTKTDRAARTIALGPSAKALALANLGEHGASTDFLFPHNYSYLVAWWDHCRKLLGEESNSTCTLKALRRTFAAYATLQNGMPLSVLKDHFGHANIKTTLGYLHLLGGANVEASRQWLI